MTQQYLIGELSMRLEQLQQVAAGDVVQDVARLRREVETGPPAGLAGAALQALALADGSCWQSLTCGDMASFACQAKVAANLRKFGICARLLPGE
jgi:hypothetical protein